MAKPYPGWAEVKVWGMDGALPDEFASVRESIAEFIRTSNDFPETNFERVQITFPAQYMLTKEIYVEMYLKAIGNSKTDFCRRLATRISDELECDVVCGFEVQGRPKELVAVRWAAQAHTAA